MEFLKTFASKIGQVVDRMGTLLKTGGRVGTQNKEEENSQCVPHRPIPLKLKTENWDVFGKGMLYFYDVDAEWSRCACRVIENTIMKLIKIKIKTETIAGI